MSRFIYFLYQTFSILLLVVGIPLMMLYALLAGG
jgi:hypothetical protein